MIDFEIWLEFEAVDSSESDMTNEATNFQVNLAAGLKQDMNINI